MDAKKAAQVWKPIYYKNTKIFKYSNWLFAGILGFSFALGAMYIYFRNPVNKPREGFLRRRLREHFESDIYKYQSGRIQGLYPSTKKNIEDAEKRSVRVNPITPHL